MCFNMGRINDSDGLGVLSKNQHHTTFGFMLHPVLVLDKNDGTPYGIGTASLFNRPMTDNPLSRQERKKQNSNTVIEKKNHING